MAEFPALTLWTDAYLSDTRHLSTLEHGAYLLLLMEAWRRPNCDLPDDDKILARLAGLSIAEWQDIKDTVLQFWKRDGRSKTWSQKRLLLERGKARVRSRSQSDKAAKRWKDTKKQNAPAMPDECPEDASTATATAHIEEEPYGSPSSREGPKSDPPVQGEKPKRTTTQPHALPDDWEPTLGPKRAAMVSTWPDGMFETQLNRFRAHAHRNERVATNWNLAFGTWIDRANQGRTQYGNSNQHAGNQIDRSVSAGPWPARDQRDGFQRSLDRELGLDLPPQPASASGRHDDGPLAGHPRLSGATR